MVNGVLLIVAAVLFAVVHVFGGLGIMWLWIAAFYLVAGILDLVFHVVKEKAKVRSANKKAEKTAQEAEASKKQAEESRKEAEEARKQLAEPKQEENV